MGVWTCDRQEQILITECVIGVDQPEIIGSVAECSRAVILAIDFGPAQLYRSSGRKLDVVHEA